MMKVKDDPIGMLGDTPAAQRVSKIVNFHEIKPGPKKIPTVDAALEGLPRIHTREAAELSHIPWEHTPKVLRRMGAVKEGQRWKGGDDHFSQSYGRLHRRGLARTITTYFANPGSGRYWHPTSNRSLTLREAARLQGFPDSFRFIEPIGRAATRLVGNALDARVAELIFQTIDQKIGLRGP
jgi:DNA (cytosine-5)-methyltransferase 1